MATFSNRLKELRKKNGLSQKALAEKVGLSERGIQNYELSTNKPTVDVLIALSNYFNVSTDYLTGRSIKLLNTKGGITMKKASQPLVLELANEETREYLKKEYIVSIPCSSEELEACQNDFDNSWDDGERTPVDDFDSLLQSINEDVEVE